MYFFVAVTIFMSSSLYAQELFVFTEPASNMPAKSLGIRLAAMQMKDQFTKELETYASIETMIGLNKKLMLHNEIYFSTINKVSKVNGAGLYGKYRFYSEDGIHKHFRMAAVGRLTLLDGLPAVTPLNLTARNSGVELGLVATQLINKFAFTTGVGYLRGWNNGKFKLHHPQVSRNAISYNLGIGKLMLPKEYTGYNQVNMNLMIEALGQINPSNGQHFLDLAPSIQFIIKSRMRADLGYRYAMVNRTGMMYRSAILFRFESNFFNLL